MIQEKMDLADWLDDLCVRFILNLPNEELAEAERICFQIEEAQWFYEDFVRPLDPEGFPSLNLRNFYMLISRHCPILSDFPAEMHENAFQKFLAYKTRVPVRGAIMINDKMDEVVLVKGWKKNANWSFPRGKINKEESDLNCAIREVYEETGLDLNTSGLVVDGDDTKSIEITMREQHMKLFVFRNVPMDFDFQPQTRKEISKIQWYKISELPTVKKNKHQQDGNKDALAGNANKFYMVAPFLGPLKKWIALQRKQDKSRGLPQSAGMLEMPHLEGGLTPEVEALQVEQAQEESSLNKILGLLQKSKRRPEADLPEVSPDSMAPVSAPPIGTSVGAAPTKANLLSLLRTNENIPTVQHSPPPQTPAAQVIAEPQMPHSPPHHHLSRMPTLPIVPQAGKPETQLPETIKENVRVPQLRPNAPQIHPSVVPVQMNAGRPGTLPAPYTQIEQGPHLLSQLPTRAVGQASLFAGEQDMAPSANKLPPPRINPQSANLLSLFKTGGKANTSKEASSIPQLDSTNEKVPAKVDIPAGPSLQSLEQSKVKPSSKAPPSSSQQASLLDLFRRPSASQPTLEQQTSPSLQLPAVPIELSASSSPGHSRKTSDIKGRPHKKMAAPAEVSGREAQSRPRHESNPGVSATINGPLNVPQFENIAHNRPSKSTATKDKVTPTKQPAYKILTRPANPQIVTDEIKRETASESAGKGTAPHSTSAREGLVQPSTSTKPSNASGPSQPPAPRLSPQPTHSKPAGFHPQILRRQQQPPLPPPQNQIQSLPFEEPSPIHPLPSPTGRLPSHIQTKPPRGDLPPPTNDHKKSLLSLFTSTTSPSPSPLVSPPSAQPLRTTTATTNATIDVEQHQQHQLPSALISPVGDPLLVSQQRTLSIGKENLTPSIATAVDEIGMNRQVSAESSAIQPQRQQEQQQQQQPQPQPQQKEKDVKKEEKLEKKQMTDVTRDQLLGFLANVTA